MPPLAINPVQATTATGYLPSPQNIEPTDGSGFASILTGAVDNVQQLKSTSNELAIKAVTGDLQDIHTATIASTQAQVTLEVVAAIRNKGIEAFNDIMRMQA
ncbi:flagellar hook-basal body complex protein FliE [Glaciibacter superstes]|uniref:flagellar hook-basal body complex protein FliE n=1 Tax=Glaciibacter superstes TaxID=501023 RepID=UPI0003B4DEFC|nr:flagellar hook-basal body complex protein FliE [Glaciibacter superstes]